MKHKLKAMECYFNAILEGEKRFEIRDNRDRGFQKGDCVIFQLIKANGIVADGDYDCHIVARIDYVTNYMQKENYVVFGFSVVNVLNPPDGYDLNRMNVA